MLKKEASQHMDTSLPTAPEEPGRVRPSADGAAPAGSTAAVEGMTADASTFATGSAASDGTQPCGDHAQAPREGSSEHSRADTIIHELAYCGHYLRFHSGGRSGRDPILCVLHCMGGQMSQQALGARFDLKPGSLSEILAKMEASGAIERTRDPNDRRQLFVHLTAAGRAEAIRALEAQKRFRCVAFSVLSTDEQDQLIALLGKVHAHWEGLA